MRCLVTLLFATLLMGACDSRLLPAAPSDVNPSPSRSPNPAPPNPAPPAPAPAAHTFSGTVRAVDGGPLEGVKVSVAIRDSPTTFTDPSGAYTLAGVFGAVVFEKQGYNTSWSNEAIPGQPSIVHAKLQLRVHLTPGVELSSAVSPDDLTFTSDLENSFWGGTYACSPCKQIRIVPTLSGRARVRLRWTGPVPLEFWVGEYYKGVVAYGSSDDQEVVVDLSGSGSDTILVGIRSHSPPSQSVAFQLTIDQQ